MHHPTDRLAHTTAFVTPVVEHWLEQVIAQWVHHMKDRSDDPSHHERMLLPRSYISLPYVAVTKIKQTSKVKIKYIFICFEKQEDYSICQRGRRIENKGTGSPCTNSTMHIGRGDNSAVSR